MSVRTPWPIVKGPTRMRAKYEFPSMYGDDVIAERIAALDDAVVLSGHVVGGLTRSTPPLVRASAG